MSSAGVAALVFSMADTAYAQESNSAIGEVVVTASRVQRLGFNAPSPTSVVGQQEIKLRAPLNLVNLINEIPAFRPSATTTTRSGNAGSGPVSADLRGLGNRRTLTLVDGTRFLPYNSIGVVDLNQIPTNMIERAEVVTGGASAAWGSDAVAGVVNFITKKNLRGLEADIMWGEAQAGDAQTWHASLTAGGTFNDDRGRVVMGGEYLHRGLVTDQYARDWGRAEQGTVTYPATANRGSDPSRLVLQGGVRSVQTPFGGTIIGVNADTNAANGTDVLRGIGFATGGVVIPYPYGQLFGTSSISGGFYGETANRYVTMVPRLDRFAFLANVEYDITPDITGTLQANFARSDSFARGATRRDANTTSTSPNPNIKPGDYILIRRNNAFLPASVAALMDNNRNAQGVLTPITQFYLARASFDLGNSEGITGTTVERIVLGLNGHFGSSWKWNASYENGRNRFSEVKTNSIESRWQDAVESVRNAAGQIVCRSNAVTIANPLCVPFNVFGNNSTADLEKAKKYIIGDRILDSLYRQQAWEANLSGEPFSTWAGPVSVAVGASYRRDSVDQRSDAVSQADDFNSQNPKPYTGAYSAKEVYGELAVPLLKDQPFFKSLELNGAARRTDYSLSGVVTTWKVGATWSINDDIRFRGAVSRDIRAPNLLELFGTITAPGSVINPFTLVGTNALIADTASNPNLLPERANSKTLGVVLEPRFIPRFRFSMDFYDITIKDAIANYTKQQIADNCGNEVRNTGKPGQFCGYLLSNNQYNANYEIFALRTIPFNLSKQTSQGVDFEAQCSLPLLGGNLDLRGFANYTADTTLYDSVGRTQYAGTITYITYGAGGTPTWRGTLNTAYTHGRATVQVQTRYLGPVKINPALIGPDDPNYSPTRSNSVNVNRIKSRVYFNLSATYDIVNTDKRKVQLYGTIENLLNKDPPWQGGFGAGTNGQFYDGIGRFFNFGMRLSF